MTDSTEYDKAWMWRAIGLAKRAKSFGHRPFGSVIVSPQGEILASEYGSELEHDTTRHSEVMAIQQAERLLRSLLHGCTLFQTHECCTYCVGAILHAKIGRVVMGSMRSDLPALFRQKQYTSQMLFQDTSDPPEVVTGVLRDECIALFDEEMAVWMVSQASGDEGGDLDQPRLSLLPPDTTEPRNPLGTPGLS